MNILESFLLGMTASAVVWWWAWRGLKPRLGLSPQITRKPIKSEESKSYNYRFKIKNMHRNINKRHAMDLSYSAHLRYRKRNEAGQFGNWATVPLQLSTKARNVLLDNLIVTFKKHRVSDGIRAHLNPSLDMDELDVKQLLTHLKDAQIYITCLATDSYSGSRRGISQNYGANDVVDGYYKSETILRKLYSPGSPPRYWRTRLNTTLRRTIHPELQVLTDTEIRKLGLDNFIKD